MSTEAEGGHAQPASGSAGAPRLPPSPGAITFRRTLVTLSVLAAIGLAYLLRGVLVPLFFAFLLAYALDPFVDWFEARRVPRALGAPIVLLAIVLTVAMIAIYAVPLFVEEVRDAAVHLPEELQRFEERVEPWLWQTFHYKPPHTMNEVGSQLGQKLTKLFLDSEKSQSSDVYEAVRVAAFGTLSYVAVALSALIVPVFALYLLIDFDRIVARTGQLIPRRWYRPLAEIARQVHRTLGGYVRGQLTANIVLGALYATGLRVVGIRLAVPIGVLTGMLAFVPYVGFGIGLLSAVAMATLDWQGLGQLLGVLAVMLGVQLMDGLLITPRIVGRSVGLAPLEVLLTMMAAGTLFGFLGVLLAVPLGAVVKILVQRGIEAYLASDFYKKTREA
jgi:predicted PurR-regulated permease PerM